MTDNEIKEDCLQEAGIDLGRYSHTELTEIKDALRRYHKSKLKLLDIANVVGQSEQFTFEDMRKAFDAGAYEHHLHTFDSWIKTQK